MIKACALLLRPVEVGIAWIAALLRGLDKCDGKRMAVAQIGNTQRPAGAVPCIGTALVILGLSEVRQHVVKAPAHIAERAPLIEVLLLAAYVDQAVDRTRTADDAAARRDDVAAVTVGLRLGVVTPVETPVGKKLAVAQWNAQPRMTAVRPRFEQQHAMFAGCCQPVRQYTASAAGADDDEVEGFRRLCHD